MSSDYFREEEIKFLRDQAAKATAALRAAEQSNEQKRKMADGLRLQTDEVRKKSLITK
jgi:hypothetical protein